MGRFLIWQLSDGEFDAAIAEEGLAGRWLNYYIEGLRQSVESSPHIDGIYFDGILFDRRTMMRVRKVLERFGDPARPGLIDFHTGNDFAFASRDLVDATSWEGLPPSVESRTFDASGHLPFVEQRDDFLLAVLEHLDKADGTLTDREFKFAGAVETLKEFTK